MSGIFDKVRHTTGLGLNENELYERAFTKGVLLHDFKKAADIFQDAARKFSESDNQAMAAQASANAMLYHYLAIGQTNNLSALIQTYVACSSAAWNSRMTSLRFIASVVSGGMRPSGGSVINDVRRPVGL